MGIYKLESRCMRPTTQSALSAIDRRKMNLRYREGNTENTSSAVKRNIRSMRPARTQTPSQTNIANEEMRACDEQTEEHHTRGTSFLQAEKNPRTGHWYPVPTIKPWSRQRHHKDKSLNFCKSHSRLVSHNRLCTFNTIHKSHPRGSSSYQSWQRGSQRKTWWHSIEPGRHRDGSYTITFVLLLNKWTFC